MAPIRIKRDTTSGAVNPAVEASSGLIHPDLIGGRIQKRIYDARLCGSFGKEPILEPDIQSGIPATQEKGERYIRDLSYYAYVFTLAGNLDFQKARTASDRTHGNLNHSAPDWFDYADTAASWISDTHIRNDAYFNLAMATIRTAHRHLGLCGAPPSKSEFENMVDAGNAITEKGGTVSSIAMLAASRITLDEQGRKLLSDFLEYYSLNTAHAAYEYVSACASHSAHRDFGKLIGTAVEVADLLLGQSIRAAPRMRLIHSDKALAEIAGLAIGMSKTLFELRDSETKEFNAAWVRMLAIAQKAVSKITSSKTRARIQGELEATSKSFLNEPDAPVLGA
jgi:hypothetical protein